MGVRDHRAGGDRSAVCLFLWDFFLYFFFFFFKFTERLKRSITLRFPALVGARAQLAGLPHPSGG